MTRREAVRRGTVVGILIVQAIEDMCSDARSQKGEPWQDLCQELVGQAEDEEVGAVAALAEVGHGPDVGREGSAGEVLDVLVLLVDDVREVAAVDLLLEDPHPDLLLELGALGRVSADVDGHRGGEVARADERDA